MSVATSQVVVDLSGNNDRAGTLAATADIPSVDPNAPFEKSCDNPECSAPKLISLVPKRETPEFVTSPVIMSTPTLINGFTTVFQVDGMVARMDDTMPGTQPVPKSVFRIVPNTHAHIVNYVVVDAAGETMRKIKSNHAETMSKLLDSQKTSAEQMLKKLIGKALDVPTQTPAQPVPSTTAPKPPICFAPPAPVPVPKEVLPSVPPGITITALPLSAAPTASKKPISNATIVKTVKNPNEPQQKVQSSPSGSNPKPLIRKSATSNAVQSVQTKFATGPSIQQKPTASTGTRVTTSSASHVRPSVATLPSTGKLISSPSDTKSMTSKIVETKPSTPTTSTASSIQNTKPSPQLPATKLLTRQAAPITPGDTTAGTRKKLLRRRVAPSTVEALSESGKRLRPRSPKNKTPYAESLEPISLSPPPPKKLLTLAKLPNTPPTSDLNAHTIVRNKETLHTKPVSGSTPINTQTQVTHEAKSSPKNSNESLNVTPQNKIKTVIGPASKMKEIIAARAAAETEKKEVTTRLKLPLSNKPNTQNAETTKDTIEASALTKPCSVAVTDISSLGKNEYNSIIRVKPTSTLQHSEGAPKVPTKLRAGISKRPDVSTKPYSLKVQSSPNTSDQADMNTSACSGETSNSVAKSNETSAASPSRILRVVLPSRKTGVVTIPVRSPHPNLKISSVTSAGNAIVDADVIKEPTASRTDTGNVKAVAKTSKANESVDNVDIQSLHKELADLRRTVARLTQKKT